MKTGISIIVGAIAWATVTFNGAIPSAQARDGGGVALGVLGGLAAGAVIGSAIAPRAYYPPPAYYEPAAPAYYERPRCYWTEGRPVWDEWRGVWSRPSVQVCD